MADDYQLIRNGEVVGRWGKGDQLDEFLTSAIAELKGEPRPTPAAPPPPPEPRSVAMPPPVTLPKPRASGLFFSLIDTCEGSERRLDDLALPLADDIRELELRAAFVIGEKRDGIVRAHDYLDRLQGYVKKLEETKTPGTGDNGGPPTEPGSAASPPPSSDAPPSPPASSDTPPAPASLMGLGLPGEPPAA